jgi:hypothetical protein
MLDGENRIALNTSFPRPTARVGFGREPGVGSEQGVACSIGKKRTAAEDVKIWRA